MAFTEYEYSTDCEGRNGCAIANRPTRYQSNLLAVFSYGCIMDLPKGSPTGGFSVGVMAIRLQSLRQAAGQYLSLHDAVNLARGIPECLDSRKPLAHS